MLHCLLILCSAQPAAIFRDEWRDPSPHKEDFVPVNGTNVHYLDWGGKGDVLLFLGGGSHSAHIFDDLAPEFVDRFRVLAVTRRGHRQSDKPESGYEQKTLVEDLRQFLDALKVKRVVLVGHSLAGTEMTMFAGSYPKRIRKLVYLDSALDFQGMSTVFKDAPARTPTKDALVSFEAFRDFFKSQKCGWSNAWEADLRQTVVFDAAGKPVSYATPGKLNKQIWDGMDTAVTDYTKIKVPTLALYALDPFAPCFLPPNLADEKLIKAQKFSKAYAERWRQSAARLQREMPQARVVEIPNSDHWFFIQNRAQTLREMRDFLIKSVK